MTPDEFPSHLFTAEDQEAARRIAAATGVESHDVVAVLGSGLAEVLDGDEAEGGWGEPRAVFPLSSLPGVLEPQADGHLDEVRSYRRGSHDVLVALGRTHLYEGVSPQHVTAFVRAAALGGASTAILCNANGCLKDWQLGDVMAIEDHLNFSGSSPFDGTIFIDTRALWDRELTDKLAGVCQRRGSYAIMRGPEYQTMAETRWLASTGADCVGMSTVMEALTLHALGVKVCGMSVVSDLSFATEAATAQTVLDASAAAAKVVVSGLDAVLA